MCMRVYQHVRLHTPCFTVCVVCSVFELSHVGIYVQVCSCCLGMATEPASFVNKTACHAWGKSP